VSRLVLVEACPPGFAPGTGDVVVATTPVGCDELRRLGVAYRLPTDFADESELASREPQYWQEQLELLTELDELLAAEVPAVAERGLRPASLYGRYLKSLLDILYIRAFELDALLAPGYDEVVLLYADLPERPPDETLYFFPGRSLASFVLPLFCERRGNRFALRPVALPPASGEEPAGGLRAALAPLMRLRLKQHARRLLVFGSARLGTIRRRGPRMTLFLLSTHYDLGPLLRHALRAGHRCLVLFGSQVVDLTALPLRRLALDPPSRVAGNWVDAATLAADRVGRVVDSWYGVPLSRIAEPRIAYWVKSVLPELVARADAFARLYREADVDFVLTPYLAELDQFAAVGGAAASRAESILVEHGFQPFEFPSLELMHMFEFDHQILPQEEFADWFRSRRGLYQRRTAEVHAATYRWRRGSRYLGRPRRESHGEQPLLVYLLTAMAGDGRYLHNAWYSDAWYFELQRRLVDVLAADDRYRVVVKLFPGEGHLSNPIDRYVVELGAPHLTTSRTPFVEWLPSADRVFMDFTSTAFYECLFAGVPCRSLVHRTLRVRESIESRIASSIARFETHDEAAALLRTFLDGPAPPVLDPGPDPGEILPLLERLASERNARSAQTAR
jgi:hypothetical protein